MDNPTGQTDAAPVAKSEQQLITPSTIKTDIFGIEIELPVATAKALIEKRDERTKVFKDLDTKVKTYENELQQTRSRLEMAEKVKAGSLVEAEAIAKKGVEEQLNKMKSSIIQKEVKATLAANERFIGSAAMDDALKLLDVSSFGLDDNNEVVSPTGKKVADVVNEFLEAKPIFRKAGNMPQGTGSKLTATKQLAPQVDAQARMAKGIDRLIKS